MSDNQADEPQELLSRFPDNGHREQTVPRFAIPECVGAPLFGEPLTIEEVAGLLGCSAWTVRQRYLKQGLPYLQARPRGKLVFFREQIFAWIEKRQRQKGGMLR